jgi:uncharacterized membrane protein
MKMPNEVMAHNNKIYRPLIGTLLASMVLNLFLAGALLGIESNVHHTSTTFAPMALASPHGEYLVGWLSRYLDPRDADTFRDAFKTQADALTAAHAHVRQATQTVAAVFGQDTPDPQALQNALGDLNRAKNEAKEAAGKILQAAYVKLSPDGRRRLADMTQNPL